MEGGREGGMKGVREGGKEGGRKKERKKEILSTERGLSTTPHAAVYSPKNERHDDTIQVNFDGQIVILEGNFRGPERFVGIEHFGISLLHAIAFTVLYMSSIIVRCSRKLESTLIAKKVNFRQSQFGVQCVAAILVRVFSLSEFWTIFIRLRFSVADWDA